MLSDQLEEAVRRRFSIYRDPETSESTEEFNTLERALKARPSPDAEIISNGRVYAHAKGKGRKWVLTPLGERMLKGED